MLVGIEKKYRGLSDQLTLDLPWHFLWDVSLLSSDGPRWAVFPYIEHIV